MLARRGILAPIPMFRSQGPEAFEAILGYIVKPHFKDAASFNWYFPAFVASTFIEIEQGRERNKHLEIHQTYFPAKRRPFNGRGLRRGLFQMDAGFLLSYQDFFWELLLKIDAEKHM